MSTFAKNMFCDMIDQIIEYNIMSPLLGDGYKAGGIGGNKQHLTYHKDVLEGASNEWLEPVTDEIYNKLQ